MITLLAFALTLAVVFGAGWIASERETRRRTEIIDRHIRAFCELRFAADDAKLDQGNEKQREVHRFICSLCDGTYREHP